MALDIKDLGVKFYASKTKAEALALGAHPHTEDSEPGAICFVSDNTGNYIIVDGKIFGDGTTGGGGGSGGGGAVDSVNGLTGVVVLDVNDINIVKDGTSLKTIGDFLKADGTVIADSFVVYETRTDSIGLEYQYAIVQISSEGIKYDNNLLSTQNWVTSLIAANNTSILNLSLQYANTAELNAKTYTDSVLNSIYKIKGSVNSYADLRNITNPASGDVYNVITSYGTIGSSSYVPPGTNYVYVEVDNTSDVNYPGYWDALGGSVDLSNYYTRTDVDYVVGLAETNAKVYADGLNTTTNARIDTNANSISSLLSTTQTLSGRISTNTTNISQNTTNINNIATQLTWQ